jgi:hypothetical protein
LLFVPADYDKRDAKRTENDDNPARDDNPVFNHRPNHLGIPFCDIDIDIDTITPHLKVMGAAKVNEVIWVGGATVVTGTVVGAVVARGWLPLHPATNAPAMTGNRISETYAFIQVIVWCW